MAAPSLRGVTNPAITTGAIDSPSATVAGDLVICYLWSQGGDSATLTHTLQSGFAQWLNFAHNDGTDDGRLSIAVTVAATGGVQSYTPFTIANATASQTCGGIVVLAGGSYDSAIATSLPAANISAASGLTNGAPNSPQIAPTTGLDYLFQSVATWHVTTAAATVATAPASYTIRAQNSNASHVTHLAIADRTMLALAAAENPGSFGDNIAPNGTVAVTIAIPGSVFTGTLTATEGADTAASTATLAIAAASSVTEASDTSASAATLAIAGSSALTEGGDTSTSAAALAIVGTASLTEGADTVAAVGDLVDANLSASASITEASDSVTSASALAIAASSTPTEGSDSVLAAGELTLAASATITEASDSSASAATLALASALAVVESDDTLGSATALTISSSLAGTEDSDTGSSAAALAIAATATITESGDTLAAEFSVGTMASSAITEDGDTLAASGGVLVEATSTLLESDDAGSATSTLSIAAVFEVLDADDTSTSAGELVLVASLAVTEASDTLSSRSVSGGEVYSTSSYSASVTVTAYSTSVTPD